MVKDVSDNNFFDEEKYEARLKEIFQRFPSVQTSTFKDAYKPGLEHMRAFAGLLGDPQDKFPTIHIAGTNGKGSTAAMIASGLSSCGCKTGLYTSPHILDFRERMRIGGAMIPKDYVYAFIMQWQETFEKLELSFFEITTGLAFKWFADSGVDAAVIEVGLGGRLDSTNIITPRLSIVTSIGLDHCDLLGNTLEKIAGEKAGIFKPGVPALVGEALPETEPVFWTKAAQTASPLYFAERERLPEGYDFEQIAGGMDLQGWYERKNLRTSICALGLLEKTFPALEDRAKAADGLIHTARNMDFHGRWERVSRRPEAIMDIGHNAAALRNNFFELDTLSKQGKISSVIIVYGVMADKDLDAIIPLMPRQATWIFTTPETKRAMKASMIMEKVAAWRKAHGLGTERLHVKDSVHEAVLSAMKLASSLLTDDGPQPLVYIGGSTFVVSEAAACFR